MVIIMIKAPHTVGTLATKGRIRVLWSPLIHNMRYRDPYSCPQTGRVKKGSKHLKLQGRATGWWQPYAFLRKVSKSQIPPIPIRAPFKPVCLLFSKNLKKDRPGCWSQATSHRWLEELGIRVLLLGRPDGNTTLHGTSKLGCSWRPGKNVNFEILYKHSQQRLKLMFKNSPAQGTHLAWNSKRGLRVAAGCRRMLSTLSNSRQIHPTHVRNPKPTCQKPEAQSFQTPSNKGDGPELIPGLLV